jgi:hypothetical protein
VFSGVDLSACVDGDTIPMTIFINNHRLTVDCLVDTGALQANYVDERTAATITELLAKKADSGQVTHIDLRSQDTAKRDLDSSNVVDVSNCMCKINKDVVCDKSCLEGKTGEKRKRKAQPTSDTFAEKLV